MPACQAQHYIGDATYHAQRKEDSAYDHNSLGILFRHWILKGDQANNTEDREDRKNVAAKCEKNQQSNVCVGKESF